MCPSWSTVPCALNRVALCHAFENGRGRSPVSVVSAWGYEMLQTHRNGMILAMRLQQVGRGKACRDVAFMRHCSQRMRLYTYQLSSLAAPLRTCAMVRNEHWQALTWPLNKSEEGLRRSLYSGRRNRLPTCWRPHREPEYMPLCAVQEALLHAH